MSNNEQQGSGAATGAAQGGSFKDRNCPNMRGCWSFSWEAYSLKTADKTVLLRRICMYIILGIRTALSVIGVVRDIIHAQVASFILGIILGVIGFFFIAWCLAVIGQAEGRRKVLGIMVVSYFMNEREFRESPVANCAVVGAAVDIFLPTNLGSLAFRYLPPRHSLHPRRAPCWELLWDGQRWRPCYLAHHVAAHLPRRLDRNLAR
ncbi:hypothetical protein EsH8_VI_000131 [Colletotrichum jinshuiense]